MPRGHHGVREAFFVGRSAGCIATVGRPHPLLRALRRQCRNRCGVQSYAVGGIGFTNYSLDPGRIRAGGRVDAFDLFRKCPGGERSSRDSFSSRQQGEETICQRFDLLE